MCGIAGILRIHDPKDGQPPHPLEAIPEAWLDILDESIKHRGPDGQGRFRDRAVREDGMVVDVAFVHRRLSIIDHEGGHQPMVHDGERLRADLTYQPGETPKLAHELCPASKCPGLVAVVFNGCIYNHRELREELEGAGHVFETDHSDTEVLVHGWRAWGLYGVDEIDGMYAASFWDRSTGQIATARDLAGEKPLFTEIVESGMVIASSLVQIVELQAVRSNELVRPYLAGFDSWLQYGAEWIPPTPAYSHSVWEWCVRPPHPKRGGEVRRSTSIMARRRRRIGDRPSWSVSEFETGRLGKLIESAVTSRMDADVPLGVFLSGGIDSGLIAAIAKDARPDLRTFTVRMPLSSIDESEAATETASVLGIENTIIDCNVDPAADVVRLVEQMGMPFGDSSLLPTYWVARAARQHVKVALSGDGGDELFGGYRRHSINTTLRRWRHLLRIVPDALLDRRHPSSRSAYLARLAIAARYLGYSELLSIFPTADLNLLARVDGQDPVRYARFHIEDDPLREDFDNYLHDDLLRKTDTASMAVGLEVRAPFLARDLVEAALRTSLDVLMPNGERKGLLKQVARKYLPNHIVDRPKQGFAIPIGEWFRSDYGGMRQLLYDHIESADPFPGLGEAGVEIKMGFVRRMLREHDAAGEKSLNPWHGRDHSQRLYMLLVLSIWAKWLERVRREGLNA